AHSSLAFHQQSQSRAYDGFIVDDEQTDRLLIIRDVFRNRWQRGEGLHHGHDVAPSSTMAVRATDGSRQTSRFEMYRWDVSVQSRTEVLRTLCGILPSDKNISRIPRVRHCHAVC